MSGVIAAIRHILFGLYRLLAQRQGDEQS